MLGTLGRGALVWPQFAACTVLLGLWLLVTNPLERSGRLAWRGLHLFWGHLVWWVIPMWHLERSGHNNLPTEPCIIVSNHQAAIDIPALLGFAVPAKVVASEANFRYPVLGLFLRLGRQIRASRFFEDGSAALDAGLSVLVFAEGSRSADGSLKRFRRGAFQLARERGVPILPVAVQGTRFIIPKGRWVPTRWRVHCTAVALPVVLPGDFDSDGAMSDHVRALIERALEPS